MMASTPPALSLGRSPLPFTMLSSNTRLISVLYIVNMSMDSIIMTMSRNCDSMLFEKANAKPHQTTATRNMTINL